MGVRNLSTSFFKLKIHINYRVFIQATFENDHDALDVEPPCKCFRMAVFTFVVVVVVLE